MRLFKNKKIYRQAIVSFIIVSLLLGSFYILAKGYNPLKNIDDGTLDLAGWNPSTDDSMMSLNGEWEFYWSKLLTYDDLHNHNNNVEPDLMAQVPKVWNAYTVNDKNLPGFGYATYRLKVINAHEGQPLSIRMPTVSTAYSLYIDDQLLASNGQVSANKANFIPEYRPVTFDFTPQTSNFDIIIQVSNFSYARGGLWYPIYMGSVDGIKAYDRNIAYKDLFLIGAFFIMALYYLSIFSMRREDKSSLYFVLLCIIAMARVVIYGDYSISNIFTWITYYHKVTIDYLSAYWFPVVFALLIGKLFPEQFSKKVLRAFVLYAFVMSIVTVLIPISLFTKLAFFAEAIVLVIVLYTITCTIKAYSNLKSDSILILIGTFIGVLVGVHDILYHNNIIFHGFGEFSSLGFLIMLFLNAFILARRFSQAFQDTKMLSEKLMKLDKLKDEFLANTSHELRTPLNAMISIADGVSRGSEGVVNKNQKAALDTIISSGKRLTNLINDILDYAKIKNFDLKLTPQPVNLKRTVEGVVKVLGGLNKSERIEMLIDIPDDLPYIYVDENRLLQILYNLMGNAIKFTEAGYIKVSATKTGEMVEICVEDTGIGIPDDKLNEIFQHFLQLEDSLTRKNRGTGLGLPITGYLVEAHGGKIWVASKVGEGSKFYVTVPVSTELSSSKEKEWKFETAEEIAAGYNQTYIDEFPFRHQGRGPKIMVLDDNEANLMALTNILKMENYAITAVTSSESFFEEFKREKNLSLIILDVMMPGLSGYEICRKIRKNYTISEIPILMLTARTSTQDIVMGIESGANDYLAKPFDTEELLARVNILIQLKQSVDKSIASELAFLQAQIKPHFLYNAINTFISISRYDVEQARKLLVDFSNYLRCSFDFKGLSQVVPLKQEIELVKAYLHIEKAQHEERLEVSLCYPDDAEVKVPILMLQPVVENAILHGILPKREGGRVEISIKKDKEMLLFQVKDDGVGMEQDKLRSLFTDESEGGIGLSNIDNRLKKLYGKGLQISSSPNRGTEVTWSIPLTTPF
ncbi:ATP-binding protein [Heliorestis convoluta]|uniref:Stage 0 sporulation protein A homolog n=1 Tax=Heliorestis convoluta TaxID=356322 RepID=A0A5Q2N2S4_9FIRM|nr:ATP-binding protein [Heliorestis convoluta]QGG47582.1 histidine kinase, putative [Heliorestis convoluta]